MDTLTSSVGIDGANKASDAKFVQMLLNNWLASSRQDPLRLDGLVGPKTIKAISSFQRESQLAPDGRIDPHGPTIKALIALQFEQLYKGVATSTLDAATHRLRLASSGLSVPGCQAELSAAVDAYFRELKRVM